MADYHDKLVTAINRILDGLADAGTPWRAQWITHQIIEDHKEALPDGDDAEFWLWSGYTAARAVVRKVINERAGDHIEAPKPQQISLPGFEREHLQDYYIVRRDGEDIGVPVTACTDDELHAKAEFHRALARTNLAHAREIDRFIAWRHQPRQAAE